MNSGHDRCAETEFFQVTGALQGKRITLNFQESTNESLLLQVKRQLANAYLNSSDSDSSATFHT